MLTRENVGPNPTLVQVPRSGLIFHITMVINRKLKVNQTAFVVDNLLW